MVWTALVLSWSEKKRSEDYGLAIRQCIAIALSFACMGPAWATDDSRVTFPDFSSLRAETLNLISGAKERVWLTTDYLTDGEIATALFLARYRKIDVQVLLGKHKARSYMSRLTYLNKQNVPVYLRPHQFRTPERTGLLTDNKLLYVNGDLDSLGAQRTYTGIYADPDGVVSYGNAFAKAAQLQIPAVPQKVPLVGTARGGRAYSSASGGLEGEAPRTTVRTPGSGTPRNGYIYNGVSDPRPAGVSTSLPKATKWEKQLRKSEADSSGGASE